MGVPTVLLARTDAESGEPDHLRRRRARPAVHRQVAEPHRRRASSTSRRASTPAIARGLAYAPYADLLWCETGTPDLEEAKQFAEAIHKQFPGKLLAYNCSPSLQLEEASSTTRRSPSSSASWARWATSSSSSRWPASTRSTTRCSSSPSGYRERQMSRLRRAAGGGVRRREAGLHRDQAPARGRRRLLRRRDARRSSGGTSSTTAMKGSTEEAQFKTG